MGVNRGGRGVCAGVGGVGFLVWVCGFVGAGGAVLRQFRAQIRAKFCAKSAIFRAVFVLVFALNVGVCGEAAGANSNLGEVLKQNASGTILAGANATPNSNLLAANKNHAPKNLTHATPTANKNPATQNPIPATKPAAANGKSHATTLAAPAAIHATTTPAATKNQTATATPATATKNQTAWAGSLAARFAAKKPPLSPAQIAFVAGEFERLEPQHAAASGYELQAVLGERAKINGVWLGVGARLGAYTLHELRPNAATLRGANGAIHLKLKSKQILHPAE